MDGLRCAGQRASRGKSVGRLFFDIIFVSRFYFSISYRRGCWCLSTLVRGGEEMLLGGACAVMLVGGSRDFASVCVAVVFGRASSVLCDI